MKYCLLSLLAILLVLAGDYVFADTKDEHQKSDHISLVELNRQAKKYWDVSLDSSCRLSRQAIQLVEKSGAVSEESSRAYLYLAVSLFYQSKYDSAVFFAVKGLDVAKEVDSKWGEGFADNLLCVLERRRANYDKAIQYGLKSAKIRQQQKDTFNLAGIYQNLANIYSLTGKPLTAIEYLSKSLELYLATRDTAGLRLVHGNIGNLYLDIKDKEKGKEHLLKALSLDNKKELNYADNTLALGTALMEFDHDYDSALICFNEAAAIYKKIGIEDGIATADQNIGMALLALEKFDSAYHALKRAEKIFIKIGDTVQIANVTASLGNYYFALDNTDSADLCYNKALDFGKRFKSLKTVNECLLQLYRLNKKKQNTDAALYYYEQYTKQQDSLEIALLSSRFINMEAKYQNIQKERKIELLTHEQERLKWREVQFYNIIFTMFALALVIGLWLYFKRKKEKQISRQQKELLIQKQKLAEKELETKRILQKEMEQEIEFKAKQLSTHALNMVQKNKVLQEVKTHLEEVSRKVPSELKQNLKKIDLLLARNMKTDKEWNLFKLYFEQVNGDFFKKLIDKNPSLNNNDLRHCALIKLNLNIKEVASLLNVSPHTVKSARYRLKRKLGIASEDSLGEFIRKV